jgi:hypothetical protein
MENASGAGRPTRRGADGTRSTAPGGSRGDCGDCKHFQWGELTMKTDIVLSTGRIVTHVRLSDDTWEGKPTTGPDELTDEEWNEYCDKLVVNSRNRDR